MTANANFAFLVLVIWGTGTWIQIVTIIVERSWCSNHVSRPHSDSNTRSHLPILSTFWSPLPSLQLRVQQANDHLSGTGLVPLARVSAIDVAIAITNSWGVGTAGDISRPFDYHVPLRGQDQSIERDSLRPAWQMYWGCQAETAGFSPAS